MISCWLLRYVVFVISNLPILKAVQNNIALPYGKQLWYKPHPVHEWHLSNDLLLFSAHQINQGWIV